jgi:GT2 family glycosyltransferase
MSSRVPTAALILVTMNSVAFVGRALDSIRALDYPKDALTVVVVDNASHDGTPDLILREYPDVKLIRSTTNTGFAGGNNIGMRAFPADYFALVNPDVVLQPGWLRALIEVLEADRTIGVAGSKVFYGDGQRLQHAGAMFRDNALTYHIGDGEADTGQYDTLRDCDYVIGAALVARGSVAEQLDYLPEAYYPAYFEEAEFCWRAGRAGYRVVYVPGAVAYHDEKHSGSGRMTLKYVRRYHTRRFLFAMRNFTTPETRHRFIDAERAWRKANARGVRIGALLLFCKLANWGVLARNLWILRA